jgi:hypothetical protein
LAFALKTHFIPMLVMRGLVPRIQVFFVTDEDADGRH